LPETQDSFAELTRIFHAPPNHRVTPTLGNYDGVAKCFRLLGEPGDSFLADEFTFSALADAAGYHGVNWVPVRIDAGGLVPEQLESLLANWNVEQRGRRPHVLYTTPCGQNPTGSTLSLERRKAIYDIACRWDLIIVEDGTRFFPPIIRCSDRMTDPYYFLQYDLPAIDTADPDFAAKYAQGFTPSFLSMDVEGRVLRNDSFSKALAPGLRLGWVTASPFFTEQLVFLTDASTMHPAGFGQSFMLELLGPRGWGINGYARWAHSLCADYRRRRDAFQAFFAEHVPPALATADVPQAGMFFWIKIAIERHPRFKVEEDKRTLMEELFNKLLEDGVVMMPASIFAIVERGQGKTAADPQV
jgi:aromatic amino acid aminotransferase I